MEVQEWLGADNQLGLDIWQNKYRDDSETFDAWLDRVSGGKEDYPFQLLCGRTAGRQH